MEKDIQIKIGNILLNCRAVGIIEKNDKILFQKRKIDKFWALPGGKIRVGEQSSNCLKRELEEEIGINVEVKNIFGIYEYFFEFEKQKIHQYIFAYKIKVTGNDEILNNEEFNGIEENEELIYKWFDIKNIDKAPIKPEFIKFQLKNLNSKLLFGSYEE